MAHGSHAVRNIFLQPVRAFSVAENVAKAQLEMSNCPFRISSTLQQNRLLQTAVKLY